ncbi:hypothetical protein LJR219_001687 [Phenylobacterium sp. LjRoot219]|uniref:hypothetical protein n=1 Tax=Phenylobacterium sp. LjRoot219 TaxID=3342283 RepID=UPI003ECEE97C
MPPRLKVFVTSDGLTDFVVATSSKVKALAAWGVRQDVFKEGQARETDDPALVAEATAHPGEVLRRPAAGRAELAKLKSAPRKPKPVQTEPAEPKRGKPPSAPAALTKFEPPPEPKGPSKAALKLVADLEARLAALEAGQAKAQARLERDRAELERRADALEAEHAQQRQQLQAALNAARQALG